MRQLMKWMYPLAAAWAVVVFVHGSVGATTLEALQKAACDNRALVKQYRTDLEAGRETVRRAKGEFLPALDAEYTLNRLNHDTYAGETRENDTFTIAGSWNLFAGFRHHYDLEAALGRVRMHEFQLASVRQDICLDVALQYLAVYKALENLKVTGRQVALYQDRLREIGLKVDVGVLKKTDLLKVKVELDNALQDKRRADAAVAAGMNRLAFETGLPLDRGALDFSTFGRLPPPVACQAECEALLLKNRSDLSALTEAMAAAGMDVAASRASLYPQVDLSLSYSGHTQDDFFMESFESSHDEVRCQAVVSMNLFDGMKKYAVTRQARLSQEKIRHEITELSEELKTSLANTLINMTVALDNLEAARTGTEAAEENLRITDLAFGQGIGTSSDVLDAIFNLSRARFNLVTARTDLFDNHFRLKRLLETF